MKDWQSAVTGHDPGASPSGSSGGVEASSDFAERSVVAVFVVDAAITGMAVIVSAIPSASAAYLFLIIVTNLSALLSC